MNKIIKQIKTFLDGSVLWVELQDQETGEPEILTRREYETWQKKGSAEQGDHSETED